MDARKKIAIAGATGRLGRQLVDVVEERGHEVVPISRTHGVDVVTGERLAAALAGVDTVIDAAAYPSNEQEPATEFFVASARNLQQMGAAAGVNQLVVVSIIGIDRFTAGFLAAKKVHEQEVVKGPLPVRILRAAQFHEFVEPLLGWIPQDNGVKRVPNMRTQLVAARAVAEVVVDAALAADFAPGAITEVAGPREESLEEAARLLVAERGEALRIEAGMDPSIPDAELYANGGALPGPGAILTGPAFADWVRS